MSHGFFQIISRAEFEELLRSFPALAPETVSLAEASGRVLARDLIAPHDWPLTSRSCMDGFAVDARDVFGAGESNPVYLECVGTLRVDEQPDLALNPGECARIATGGSLPQNADAVVMVEHTVEMDGGTVEIQKSAAPGLNVMHQGEDAQTGQPILKAGVSMNFKEIGLAAALGFDELEVVKKPRMGILSTGDELIPVNETPRPGQVRDVNSHTLSVTAEAAGAIVTRYGIIRDNLKSLTTALANAMAENDLVLLSGGSSIGVRDLTVQAIEAQPDSAILAHGVAVSPGKPTILGTVGQTPIMGLPGQVASAQVVMLVLALPLIRHLQGDARAFDKSQRPRRQAVLARNVASKQGREDYVRVRLEERPGQPPLAHPVLGKSGLLRTMVNADGLAIIPAESEGLYADAAIEIWIV
ncbi:molybdopterin molybdotransferase MoeA [Salidesulfovibrio onnuriiensis]|uniref:molybdopterin molybdotransferase MoeA n=1 Tax=Salidesulfovibrio onnuriiensis TaxID=2583823 RepID=UPI0011CC50F3|nr:gephyrin-like molybdotransferase Glp [Salidesulfovibrio onnuriiensis]